MYYPPIQQIQPETFTQPTHSLPDFELMNEQLLDIPGFSIQDFDGMDMDSNTTHQNQDLSSDLSPSSPRQRAEELDNGKHKKIGTRCGTDGHYNK